MMFKKVGAVILLVSDMDRSIEFYMNVLELEMKSRTKEWTEFIKDGTVLALHPTKFKDLRKDGVLIAFKVSNLDDFYKKVKSKKVKFVQEPTEEAFGKYAIIEDPDGYRISIVEMKLKEAEEMKPAPGYYGFTPV
jgi:predicted enzyme related to lactoylglutathione lyase